MLLLTSPAACPGPRLELPRRLVHLPAPFTEELRIRVGISYTFAYCITQISDSLFEHFYEWKVSSSTSKYNLFITVMELIRATEAKCW